MASVEYLTGNIAAGDGRGADPTTPLTRYYIADGYPPGHWLGSGLAGLATIHDGDEVSETQLHALFQHGTDPTTGANLGRPIPVYPTRSERTARRIAALPEKLPPSTREQLVESIKAEEHATPSRHAVSGFDLTFSVPKSVSALWAIADHGTQIKLYDAHRAAMRTVLSLIEVEALRTRVGAQGVGRVATRGMVAAAFDHWDSRKGDPQLHAHVTLANRVQGNDGIWRTVDSRTLFRSVVAYSETYNALLADEVTRRTGLTWQQRERGRGRRPGRELAAVPQSLIAAFSQRSADIEAAVDEAVDQYVARHGRRPTSRSINRIRQHVTLETRPDKVHGSLAAAVQQWRGRAEHLLGIDPDQWTAQTMATGHGQRPVMVRADDITVTDTSAIAAAVISTVSNSRATWSRWNITAETMRQVAATGWQFADPEDLLAVRDRIVDGAEQLSVTITAPELATTPALFRDQNGESIFRRPMVFTSQAVLAAEDALLKLAADTSGPTVDIERAHRIAEQPLPGRDESLSPDDQAPAAVTVATSGRRVDTLVGPAGTGKTTTLAGIRAMWEAEHGPGSVVGLAPSARAAQVLADELNIETDNTAQWLAQQALQPGRAHAISALQARKPSHASSQMDQQIAAQQRTFDKWSLRPGQLLIVDEAGMAGTFALHRLAAQAAESGAKLLLVGDPYQLSAVETGGAFGLLAAARADTPTLTEVRRFTEPDGAVREWEQQAADAWRIGDESAIHAYETHHRVTSGGRGDVTDAAYRAWLTDTAAGRLLLLIAADNDTVHDLNERARTDLVTAGAVSDHDTVTLHDGLTAGRGDRVVTRKIDRYLPDGTAAARPGRPQRGGFVHNGQQWLVDRPRRDGSLTVRLLDPTGRPSAARVTLPADYVRQHVGLAYATTAHRAQGVTVDSAHVVADAATTREVFYVAMTRGRRSNKAYLVLDPATGPATQDQHRLMAEDEPWTVREVMHAIATNVGREASAHETIRDEQDAAGSIAQLAAEAETIAAHAHRAATANLLYGACSDSTAAQRIVDDPNFAAVVIATRAAHLAGVDVRQALAPRPYSDEPATIADRIRSATSVVTAIRRPRRRMVAGVIPDSTPGLADPQMLAALRQRYALIERRADELVDRAVANREPWIKPLIDHRQSAGSAPWHHAARMIAAYRDRWQITAATPLGPAPDRSASYSQQADYRRAFLARSEITAGVGHSATPAVRAAGRTL